MLKLDEYGSIKDAINDNKTSLDQESDMLIKEILIRGIIKILMENSASPDKGTIIELSPGKEHLSFEEYIGIFFIVWKTPAENMAIKITSLNSSFSYIYRFKEILQFMISIANPISQIINDGKGTVSETDINNYLISVLKREK